MDLTAVRKLATCDICGNFLNTPITLPCHNVVCEFHLKDSFSFKNDKIKCSLCNKDHEIPENGFEKHQKIMDLIESNVHLYDHEKAFIEKMKTLIENYENILDKTKSSKLDTKIMLEERTADIKNKIDLDIENLKLKLDEIRDELFEKINKLEIEIYGSLDEINDENQIERIEQVKNEWNLTKNSSKLTEETFEQDLNEKINASQHDMDNLEKIMKNIFKINYFSKNLNTNDVKSIFYGNLNTPQKIKLITGTTKKAIKFWDLEKNIKFIIHDENFIKDIKCLAIYKNNLLISGSEDGEIKFWDMNKDFSNIKTIKIEDNAVFSLAITPKNELISGFENGSIKIWNLSDFECIKTLNEHFSVVFDIKFYMNQFITCSSDKTIKFWNYYNDKSIKTLINDSELYCMLIHQNKTLLTGSYNGKIKTWSLETFECLATYDAHESFVFCLVLTKNDELISGDGKGVIKLWNMIDLSVSTKILQLHTSSITSIQLVDESDIFISTSMDGRIILYDLNKHKTIERIEDDKMRSSILYYN